jgi:hypothetical protein
MYGGVVYRTRTRNITHLMIIEHRFAALVTRHVCNVSVACAICL